MTDNIRVQVFKEYSVDFSSNIPTIDEDLARQLIKYLYRDDTIVEKTDNTYNIATIGYTEKITRETTVATYRYALKINCFRSGSKYIVAGLIVSGESRIPYFFLCAGQKLTFWKTDIDNYDGNFEITADSFLVEGKLGITKDVNTVVLYLPRKSAFLLGKYQDVIKDQDRIKYESTSTENNLFIFEGTQQAKSVQRPNKLRNRKK